jgi:hypothetical protein
VETKTTQLVNPMTARSTLSAVSAGIIASLVDSIIFVAARITGITRYNKEFRLARFGDAFSRTPAAWFYGLILSLVVGGLVGWLYALGFEAIRKQIRSGWDTGIGLGVVHWLIAGSVMGLTSGMGYFAGGLGTPTVVLFFLSHLVFGAIVGGLYLPPTLRVHDLGATHGEAIEHEHAEVITRKAS